MSGAGEPRFVTGSTLRHVVVMTVAGSAGLLFMFLVDFIALWWIGQLRDEQLVAAVGFAWTIQFAAVSVGIGLMIATLALVSRALGRNDNDGARRLATSAMVLTVGLQTAVAVLVLIFRREILAVSGAEGETLEIGARYLALSTPSLTVMALSMVAAAVLRAKGEALQSMSVTLSAGAVSLVADPALIIWAGLGVDGAAYGVAVSRCVSAAVGFWMVARWHGLFGRPRWEDIRATWVPFMAIAMPAVATQMSTPFGNWVLTLAIAEHGDSAVAGWGVVTRLTVLAFGGIFALSGAIGGIFGQNYGVGRMDRVAATYLDALKFCVVYTLVVWAALAAADGWMIRSFALSIEGAEVVRAFTRYAAGAFLFTGALFVANSAFNNLDRPLWSTGFNWLRDGLLMYPTALLMGGWLGAAGVIYAQAVAGVIVGVVAAAAGWHYVKSLRGRVPVAAPG
ncbi:MATE family efflux transporter [Algicella marina]|uniref:Multidrug transporter n=1 Tax=Algicella marina TaxID=2683284 RepID=A0A6P1T995_9RHOB|nr:MATE family efflux transporter [Algicella marina]QHQ37202.1 multidrug transporter [Algicella marina]